MAVLGTVDMLEMSQNRQCVGKRTRTQAGADLKSGTFYGTAKPQRDVIPLDHTTLSLRCSMEDFENSCNIMKLFSCSRERLQA